ncbi:MAG: TlpA disulfide reductase family protein [Balneolaceae bacterium]|nr:TlpA disulfide reductase family protein [Balneolaceae bacterium]
MKKPFISIALGLTAMFAVSCSGGSEEGGARMEGRLTVADSVDQSGDYSGIGVTVVREDSAGAITDTLFHQVTDSTGRFAGMAKVPAQNRYPLSITRNQSELARVPLYLSADDTVRVTGDLANLQQTLDIHSREHEALELFQRMNRTIGRVRIYAQAGRISADSLSQEMNKWSGLYWEVYERYPTTIAGKMAATESIRILNTQDPDSMMLRLNQVRADDDLVGLAATYGKDYLAQDQGLDHALAYLDTLQQMTEGSQASMRIRMERIKLLYDSARVETAQNLLTDFQNSYPDNPTARNWSEAIQYDLDYLAPGDTIPEFSFGTNGGTVSRESLLGTPYILEITSLASRTYQQQFDRTVVIHSIYRNYGLQVVTLPLDESQVTIEGFFEERVQPWPVAQAGAYDRQELVNRFNIRGTPTRFLVDRQGRIVRRYVGTEFRDIIQGIQTLINNEGPAS